MVLSISKTISPSSIRSIPKEVFILPKFKSLVNKCVRLTDLPNRFKPRLYEYSDYDLPKFYALASTLSLDAICEMLNDYYVKIYKKVHKKSPMRFADGKRMRRFVPHQTSVDGFFRKLTNKEVNTIFGNVLTEMIRHVKKKLFH